MALAVEAAELVEIFQWMTPDESVAVKDAPDLKHDVEEGGANGRLRPVDLRTN